MAKQYETGNGLTHCPRCGVSKNPTENKCKKCGLDLINLDVFKFGISAASGSMMARLKLFEESVNSVDKKIVEERENSLSKAIKWMRGVETKTFVKTGEKDVYRENSRGEIEVRTEDEGYVSKSTEQDFERAETFLKSAVRHGSTEAAVKLAELYASGKLGKSTEFVGDVLSLLCSAAVHGNDKAARALFGRGYELKLDQVGYWKSQDNGLEFIKSAAAIGLTWGKYCLGRFNFFGYSGLKKDEKLAREFINSAANDDFNPSPRANRHVALCIFDGVGGYKKDIDAALVYARSAGALKNKTICEMLNRTDLCKGDKFVVEFKDGVFNVGDQFDYVQLNKLIQDATERYRKIKNAIWAYSYRGLGHGISEYDRKYPKIAPCAFLMNGDRAKQWADRFAKGDRTFGPKSGFAGRGIIVDAYHIHSSDTFEEFERGIKNFEFSDLFSKKVTDIFFETTDFAGLDCSQDDFVDYLKYLRRYILWDRKAGVELIDGSVQKEIIAKEVDVPTTTVVKSEVYKRPSPEALAKHKLEKEKERKAVASGQNLYWYVILGLVGSPIGLHFAYARRWILMICHLALFAGGLAVALIPSVLALAVKWMAPIRDLVKSRMAGDGAICGQLAGYVDAVLSNPFWILLGISCVWSVLFMHKDGTGHKMRWSVPWRTSRAVYIAIGILAPIAGYKLLSTSAGLGLIFMIGWHLLYAGKWAWWLLLMAPVVANLGMYMAGIGGGHIQTITFGTSMLIYLVSLFCKNDGEGRNL